MCPIVWREGLDMFKKARASDDKMLGYILLVGSLAGIGCYFYLVFISPWTWLVVQVSASLAVAAVLAVMAWIGYTLIITSH